MSADAALRELHRIIDQRIAQWTADRGTTDVRGVVAAVGLHVLSAYLDLADVPTPGIAVPAGLEPVVGDDVLVRRRADGFLVVAGILGRDGTQLLTDGSRSLAGDLTLDVDSTRTIFEDAVRPANIYTDLLTTPSIRFPATQVPSSGVNDLDDYEEGTWTPGFAAGGSSSGVTYAAQHGYYTRVGNKVTFWLRLQLTNDGAGSGNATITGLPFAVADDTNGRAAYSVGSYSNLPGVTGLLAWSNENTSVINLYTPTADTATALTEVSIDDDALFIISGAYRA